MRGNSDVVVLFVDIHNNTVVTYSPLTSTMIIEYVFVKHEVHDKIMHWKNLPVVHTVDPIPPQL